jgi:hypothetical protein
MLLRKAKAMIDRQVAVSEYQGAELIMRCAATTCSVALGHVQ